MTPVISAPVITSLGTTIFQGIPVVRSSQTTGMVSHMELVLIMEFQDFLVHSTIHKAVIMRVELQALATILNRSRRPTI